MAIDDIGQPQHQLHRVHDPSLSGIADRQLTVRNRRDGLTMFHKCQVVPKNRSFRKNFLFFLWTGAEQGKSVSGLF
jgi:hypothetical protein